MTTISTAANVATLINVFTVKPEHQQRLADVLSEAATTMNRLRGYISSNVHKSLDGTRVVNYVQWQSREDFEAMLENPKAAPHMEQAAQIADKYEPLLYEVSFVDEIANGADGSKTSLLS